MQLESFMQDNVPLISSSLTFAIKISSISIRNLHRGTAYICWLIVLQQELRTVKLAFVSAGAKHSQIKTFEFPLSGGTVMASNVVTDDKLSMLTGIVSAETDDTNKIMSVSSHGDRNNYAQQSFKIKKDKENTQTDPNVNRVCNVNENQSNSIETDSNCVECGNENNDDNGLHDKDMILQRKHAAYPAIEEKIYTESSSDQHQSPRLFETLNPSTLQSFKNLDDCAKQTIQYCKKVNVPGDKNDENSDKQSIETQRLTDTYIAPEQALVTSVELVVPATTLNCAQVSQIASIISSSQSGAHISEKLAYNSNFFQANNKTNGCETDSSNLTVRIPNLALEIATTGDILAIADRRAIWAPHGENKDVHNVTHNHGHTIGLESEPETPLIHGEASIEDSQGHHHVSDIYLKEDRVQQNSQSDGYQAIYRCQQHYQHEQLKHPHSAELLLQIEKESLGNPGQSLGQILSLQHHHNLTQQHFSQQRSPHLQNQIQNNMHTEIMHNQIQHQHQPHNLSTHQEIIREQQQQSHYANYSHQHYSNDQLFSINPHLGQSHSGCHQQRQHIEDLENCQQHSIQQGRSQVLQQMQDSYHDIMMDEFREDPSSAFKLSLSPTTRTKQENQDDGYETSAGDVLTPNSHSSSTHSTTPQHHIQHIAHGIVIPNKREEPMPSQNTNINSNQNLSRNQTTSTSNGPQVVVSNNMTTLSHPVTQNIHQQSSNNVGISLPNDPYSFVGGESAEQHSNDLSANSNVKNFAPAPGPVSTSVIGSISALSNDVDQSNEIYNIKPQQQSLPQHQHLSNSKSFVGPHNTDACRPSQEHDNLKCDLNTRAGPMPKRRGRKKKVFEGDVTQMMPPQQCETGGKGNSDESDFRIIKPKERRKHDRFNGMSEAEVVKRTIPDHLSENLDIVIVGINPGLFAAYKGHHYAGPGNHFWKCLYLSGLTQEQMSADEDHKLLKHGIGFTNMVARATKGSADLTRKEIKDGSRILLDKLQRFRPKVAVFNGKLIFEVFSGKKEFHFGRQPDRVDGTDTYIWVMPSSSARCAQLPRAADKVPFYVALKKFRDFLNGLIPHMDESECIFTEQRITQCSEQQHAETISLSNNNVNVCNQQASLMFADNLTKDGTECLNQIADKQLMQFNNNVSNAMSRQQFSHDGNEKTLASDSISIDSPSAVSIGARNNYLSVFGQQHQSPLPEKKKRGRPKKIKGQEMVNSSTGSKISISNLQMPQHDFNNILNLSIISSSGNVSLASTSSSASGDTPTKKKRGRPKKLKPTIENTLTNSKQQTAIANGNPNTTTALLGSMSSVHTLSMEHTASPQSSHHAPPSLYNTPPPSHILYTASASPMASPALNCSYSHGTPPQLAQVDQQHTQQNTDLHLDNHPNQTVCVGDGIDSIGMREQPPNLGETPPPSSPNICTAVDFEPPNDRTSGHEPGHVMSQQAGVTVAGREGNLIIHGHDHYPQWLSPGQSQHQESAQKLIRQSLQSQSSPVGALGHYAQAQQQSNSQTPLHYPVEQADHWQRYEEHERHYIASPHHNQPHLIALSSQLPNSEIQVENQSLVTSDVSRKSLSGLESLVDQIPSVNEHESISSTTAVTAAVENRLLELQQQQKHCSKENDVSLETTVNNNNNVPTNSFSVSNLAASSASNNASTSSRSEAVHNTNINTNSCNEYQSHSPANYSHHANHLISAALVAATTNTTHANAVATHHITQPHSHPHTQMYMDHAHITSQMYGSPYGSQHVGSGPEYPHSPYGVQAVAPTLHVPSSTYPFAHYTSAQGNYPGFPHGHSHPHHHGHAPHPLSVFERFKPSDISGYSGF